MSENTPGLGAKEASELKSRVPHIFSARAFAVAAFVACASWAFLVPLLAGEDEPSHVIKAVATVRGEFVPLPFSKNPREQSNWGDFKVPRAFAEGVVNMVPLFISLHGAPPSSHIPPYGIPTEFGPEVRASSIVAHFPPTYYLLVGWPSLLFAGKASVFAMRIISAALSGCAFAVAFACLRTARPRGWLMAGLALALTPMEFELAGMVQPNGFLDSLAVMVWGAGVALICSEHLSEQERRLVHVVGVGCLLLCLITGLGPYWAAAVVAVLSVLAGPRRLSQLVSLRATRAYLLFGAVVGGGCALYYWRSGALRGVAIFSWDPRNPIHPGVGVWPAFRYVLASTGIYVQEMVGRFGLYGLGPVWVAEVWIGVTLAFVGAGLALGKVRQRVAILLALVVTLLIPYTAVAVTAGKLGANFNGRYVMAGVTGVLMVSAVAIEQGFEERDWLAGLGRRWRAGLPLLVIGLSACVTCVDTLWFAWIHDVGRSQGLLGVFASSFSPALGLPLYVFVLAAVLATLDVMVILAAEGLGGLIGARLGGAGRGPESSLGGQP